MKIHNPPMKFANEEAIENWQKCYDANHDNPYGEAVLRYVSEWATRMEEGIAKDIPSPTFELVRDWIAANAERISRDADTEGITGFMYGCAVSCISQCWLYGETLRRWHNKDTQIGDEGDKANESGGVLNPALLRVS